MGVSRESLSGRRTKIGWSCTKGHKIGDSITVEEAEDRHSHELSYFEIRVAQLVTVKLTQHQFDALVSFASSALQSGGQAVGDFRFTLGFSADLRRFVAVLRNRKLTFLDPKNTRTPGRRRAAWREGSQEGPAPAHAQRGLAFGHYLKHSMRKSMSAFYLRAPLRTAVASLKRALLPAWLSHALRYTGVPLSVVGPRPELSQEQTRPPVRKPDSQLLEHPHKLTPQVNLEQIGLTKCVGAQGRN